MTSTESATDGKKARMFSHCASYQTIIGDVEIHPCNCGWDYFSIAQTERCDVIKFPLLMWFADGLLSKSSEQQIVSLRSCACKAVSPRTEN